MTNLDDIKKLRTLTGVGLTEAKRALEAAQGNFEVALEAMRKQGQAKVAKRADKQALAGVLASYLHDKRIGVLVELNCETDFSARHELFLDLAHNLCLQVAANGPTFVDEHQLPEAMVAEIRQAAEAEKLPADKLELVVSGRCRKLLPGSLPALATLHQAAGAKDSRLHYRGQRQIG